jgi:hypothetical protein
VVAGLRCNQRVWLHPFSAQGTNLNQIIGSDVLNPINGTASHGAYLYEIMRVASLP